MPSQVPVAIYKCSCKREGKSHFRHRSRRQCEEKQRLEWFCNNPRNAKASTRNWKKQGRVSFLESPERVALLALDF